MSKNLLEALDMLLGLTDGDPEKLKLIAAGYKLGRGESENGIAEKPTVNSIPIPKATVSLDPMEVEALRRSQFVLTSQQANIPIQPTKRLPNRGLRATILRLLTTGPSGYDSLRKCASMEDRPLKTCLKQLIDSDMIAIDKGGFCVLTSKGWPKANFFRANPELKIRPAHPAKKA